VQVDFIMPKVQEDTRTPMILKRPFLAPTTCFIDVKNGKLFYDVGDDGVEFDFLRLLNFLSFLLSVI